MISRGYETRLRTKPKKSRRLKIKYRLHSTRFRLLKGRHKLQMKKARNWINSTRLPQLQCMCSNQSYWDRSWWSGRYSARECSKLTNSRKKIPISKAIRFTTATTQRNWSFQKIRNELIGLRSASSEGSSWVIASKRSRKYLLTKAVFVEKCIIAPMSNCSSFKICSILDVSQLSWLKIRKSCGLTYTSQLLKIKSWWNNKSRGSLKEDSAETISDYFSNVTGSKLSSKHSLKKQISWAS